MKYEVTFEVVTNDLDINGNPIGHYLWTATYKADDFAMAERLALKTLEVNKDKTSTIRKIELW